MSYEVAWDSVEAPWESESRAPRRGLPAWLLSVMLHLTAMLALAFVPRAPARDVPGDTMRVAGIALVQKSHAETAYLTEDDAAPSPAASAATAHPSPALTLPSLAAANSSQVPVTLPAVTGSLPPPAASLPAAGGLATGNQPSRQVGGGQATTQVFGAQGTGSRFVYVFDRSASMQGFQGRPMAASRAELLKSLESLESIHQFQIVFYNDSTSIFNPFPSRPPHLMLGTDENKELAAQFVRNIVPAGSTWHREALLTALGMQPDVIFFLTDAAEPQLTPGELAQIRARNRTGAVIHSIEFGSGPYQGADNFLVKLARQSGGEHVYVDVTRLGDRRQSG